MKTDADLKRDVTAELVWDPVVKSMAIGVAVKDGVVTLSGTVHSWQERDAAQGVAWSAPGVLAVVDELRVG